MSLEVIITVLVVVVGLGATIAFYAWDRARRARTAPQLLRRQQWPGRLPGADHGGHEGSHQRPSRLSGPRRPD